MVEGSLLDPPNLNDSPSIEHREGSDSCRALPSRWHPAPTRRWTECLQFADLEKRVTDIDRFSSPRPHSTSGPDLTSTPGLCVCLPFPQATNAPTLPAPRRLLSELLSSPAPPAPPAPAGVTAPTSRSWSRGKASVSMGLLRSLPACLPLATLGGPRHRQSHPVLHLLSANWLKRFREERT